MSQLADMKGYNFDETANGAGWVVDGNGNEVRDKVNAKTLTTAKRAATRMRAFYGTVLRLYYNNDVVSVRQNGEWRDNVSGLYECGLWVTE